MNILTTLIGNIHYRVLLIKQDFIGFNFDGSVIVNFFINVFATLLFLFLFYSLGKRIISRYKNKRPNQYDYLFNIATGYILTASGIAILGITSHFNLFSISLYLALITIYSLVFPLSIKVNFLELISYIKRDFLYLKKSKVIVYIWVILFIILGLIKLLNPEVREDQYHVDLPAMYLNHQTIMIEPREQIKVSGSPLLSEMIYAVNILYLSKESTRYIHYLFYFLVILTLLNFSKLKNYKFAIFTPILFASAPVVIHETSSMYVDFQWIFCFLLSVLIMIDKENNRFAWAKSGFMFGGMIATKLWTIVFTVVPVLYILIDKVKLILKMRSIVIFAIFILIPYFLWIYRSTLLTGSPLFPAFSTVPSSNQSFINSISMFIGINFQLINILHYTNVFSPLFFISFLFIFQLHKMKEKFLRLRLFKYLLFLLILYLSIQYPFGRYLLGLYTIAIFFNALLINSVYKHKLVKIIVNSTLFITFSYYLINSMLVLPYTFGLADKSVYLSRILIRDASSYYDFGGAFNKYINLNDRVAMYGYYGYYYADFNYSDIKFIFTDDERSLNLLKKKGFTKLMLRGVNLNQFCKEMIVTDCDIKKPNLISSYSQFPGFYLYNLN